MQCRNDWTEARESKAYAKAAVKYHLEKMSFKMSFMPGWLVDSGAIFVYHLKV